MPKSETKRIACAVLCAAFLLWPGNILAQTETITLVADGWCPYNCEPNSDRPGYIVELAKTAFAKHNITVKYSNLPWARAIEETRQGKYDGIIGAYYSDAPDFIFPANPQGICKFSFFVKNDDPWKYDGIPSLENRALGVINDYSYSKKLDQYINDNKNDPTRVQILSGDNALDSNVKKLLAGRINTFIEDTKVISYYLSPPEYEEVREAIVKAGSLPDNDDGNGSIYIAFNPNHPKSKYYADLLSEETARMRENGELDAILSKYGILENRGKQAQ